MEKNVIIDNGSYEMKYGLTTDDNPIHVPNCMIRTHDRRFVLGQQLLSQQTDFFNIQIRRPIENNGQLTQWMVERHIWDDTFLNDKQDDEFLKDSNLIYLETPITLTKFQNNTDQVIFEEFQVQNYYRCSGSSLTPWLTCSDELNSSTKYSDFQLVIDSGFDSTWIIPVVYGLPYWKAIKRLPLGGRILNGYLREIISFRHYNVTDETILVNNIKEKTCYVSQDFNESLKQIENLRKLPLKQQQRHSKSNELILNYILPEDKSLGYTLTEQELANHKQQSNLQVLKLYDERFTIPELIFQPELAGLHKAGLIQTIQESLKLVPELIRPLLLANLVTIGGGFNIPGFKERLITELKQVIPINNEVRLFDFKKAGYGDDFDYSNAGFHSAKKFYENEGFKKTCVSRDEYMEFGAEYTQEKFGYKIAI